MQLHPLIKILRHFIIYISFFTLSISAALQDSSLKDLYMEKFESLYAKSADPNNKIDPVELSRSIKEIVSQQYLSLSLSEFNKMYGLVMCCVFSLFLPQNPSLPPQTPSINDLIASMNANSVVADLMKNLFKASMIAFAQEMPSNIKKDPKTLYDQIFKTFVDIYRYAHRNLAFNQNPRDIELQSMLINPDAYFNSSNESINPRASANDIVSSASSVALDSSIAFQSNNPTDFEDDFEDDNDREENDTYESKIEQSDDILFQPLPKIKSEQSKPENQEVKSHAIRSEQPKLTQHPQLSEQPVDEVNNIQTRNVFTERKIIPTIMPQHLIA